MLLAEQLEFDFFAPPEHEKPKADKKPAVLTAIKASRFRGRPS